MLHNNTNRQNKTKQKLAVAKDVAMAYFVVGHCVAGQQYVPVYSSWLLATNREIFRCSQASPILYFALGLAIEWMQSC